MKRRTLGMLLVLIFTFSAMMGMLTMSASAAAAPKLNKTSVTIAVGESYTLKLSNATASKVTWSTSKKTVATVKSGKVTAKKAGTATITAKYNSKSYKCTVKVVQYRVYGKKSTLSVGDTMQLSVKGKVSGKNITWSSSDKSVLTVSSKGKVTAMGEGSAKIYAKVNGKKYAKTIKVKAASAPADTYKPDGKAGTVKYLSWYEWTGDNAVAEQFSAKKWGGTLEYNAVTYGERYDRLAVLIAADESPDLVNFDTYCIPANTGKKYYQALDKYIDYNTDLWIDMKSAIEEYAYKGKHYYYPFAYTPGNVLMYNTKTVKDSGITDPMKLYENGNWTWNTWKDVMGEFCALSDENIGYIGNGDALYSFINTSGEAVADMTAKGKISANVKSDAVTRAANFLNQLNSNGLAEDPNNYSWWMQPATWGARNSDKALFFINGVWAAAEAEKAMARFGIEGDIAFVPMPRDPSADDYYQNAGTDGYLVPKGAKNVKGAVAWIYCNRMYTAGDDSQKEAKKSQMEQGWSEDCHKVWADMVNPSKFSFVYEFATGVSDEISEEMRAAVNNTAFFGADWQETIKDYYTKIYNLLEESYA